MPRIKLAFPEKALAQLSIPIRITDINYGNHVGNDSFVSLLHEARMQWLQHHVFFIIGNSAITPNLNEGTILAGVTRDSAMTVLGEMGLKVEERPLSIEEIIAAHKAGELKEVFGTGTAATISLIRELGYQDYVMNFDVDSWKSAPELKKRLNAIRYGQVADEHGWMYKI